jgi:hypothetical protein
MSYYWTTKDGKEILISEMEHSHVINCINLMVRKYPEHFSQYKVTDEVRQDVEVARRKLNGIIALTNKINSQNKHSRRDSYGQDSWWDIEYQNYIRGD